MLLVLGVAALFYQPEIVTVIGMVVYGEALDIWVMAGAVVIVAGNYLNIWAETRRIRVA